MFGLKWPNKKKQELVSKQRISFEDLLGGIKTEEGRHYAILMAVERGVTQNPAHLDIAYNNYLQKGDNRKAARVAERKGDLVKAAELYVVANDLWSVKELIGKTGNIEIANRLRRLLAEEYEKIGDYEGSAIFYKKIGNEDKLKEMVEKEVNRLKECGDAYLEDAARFAKRLGYQNVADELYNQAIAAYEQKGDLVRVADVKMDRGDVAGARDIYLKLSEIREVKGQFREAAYLLKKAGEEERSKKLDKLACLLHGD